MERKNLKISKYRKNKKIIDNGKKDIRFFQCDRCSYSSENREYFKLHLNSHSKWDAKIAGVKNPIKCKIYSIVLKDKKHLISHIGYVQPKVKF